MIKKVYLKLISSKEGSYTPESIYGVTLWFAFMFFCSYNKGLLNYMENFTSKNPILASIIVVSSWAICMIIPVGISKIIKKFKNKF